MFYNLIKEYQLETLDGLCSCREVLKRYSVNRHSLGPNLNKNLSHFYGFCSVRPESDIKKA